jgi:hypothetical protein
MADFDERDEMDFEDEEDTSESETKESAAEPTPGPRKRGRKKGVKVGPRPTVWTCGALVDGECVMEDYRAPEGSSFDELENFSSDDARKAFADDYNVEIEDVGVKGPYHAKKGGQGNAAARKRETVSISLPKLTTKRESAIYKGWTGMAYAIEGRDDVVYFMFGEEVNPSPDKKKNTPTAKTVFKTALEFTQATNQG